MNCFSMDGFTRYAMLLSCLLNAALKGDHAISALKHDKEYCERDMRTLEHPVLVGEETAETNKQERLELEWECSFGGWGSEVRLVVRTDGGLGGEGEELEEVLAEGGSGKRVKLAKLLGMTGDGKSEL